MLDCWHFQGVNEKLNGLGVWEATQFGAQAAYSWYPMSLMTTGNVSECRHSALHCERDVLQTERKGLEKQGLPAKGR